MASSGPTYEMPALRMAPLGGVGEFGKNMTVLEYDGELLLIDAGVGFFRPHNTPEPLRRALPRRPEFEAPDLAYLHDAVADGKRLAGLVVTHGHLDHWGGVPYLLNHTRLDVPLLLAPPLATRMLQQKVRGRREGGLKTDLVAAAAGSTHAVGEHFRVEFLQAAHSMPDSCSLAVTTPVGPLIWTGDFKCDVQPAPPTPAFREADRVPLPPGAAAKPAPSASDANEPKPHAAASPPTRKPAFALHRLAELGAHGNVLALFSDSTNAHRPGTAPSERDVLADLEAAVAGARGRVIVTTFSTSLHRMQMLLGIAHKHRRKVFIAGPSMANMFDLGRELGHVQCPDELLLSQRDLAHTPDREALVLATGCQNQVGSVLNRAADGTGKRLDIRGGDTVIFSSSRIPGQQDRIDGLVRDLAARGATVVESAVEGSLHASGHGCAMDHLWMLALTRPRFFVPVHGDTARLEAHVRNAVDNGGFREADCFVLGGGDALDFSPVSATVRRGEVPHGTAFLDSSFRPIVPRPPAEAEVEEALAPGDARSGLWSRLGDWVKRLWSSERRPALPPPVVAAAGAAPDAGPTKDGDGGTSDALSDALDVARGSEQRQWIKSAQIANGKSELRLGAGRPDRQAYLEAKRDARVKLKIDRAALAAEAEADGLPKGEVRRRDLALTRAHHEALELHPA